MKAFQSVCCCLRCVPSQRPVSMTTPSSLHLQAVDDEWKKFPVPRIWLTRLTPPQWQTTKTCCPLSKVWREVGSMCAAKVNLDYSLLSDGWSEPCNTDAEEGMNTVPRTTFQKWRICMGWKCLLCILHHLNASNNIKIFCLLYLFLRSAR